MNDPTRALTIDQVQEWLKPFLDTNPASSIEEFESREDRRIGIKNPWGDESLAIFIPDDIQPLADALNTLYLPERFTALWHNDTKDFEIIWTAHPLSDSSADLPERNFLFRHNSREYKCEFSKSSGHLLILAENSEPISQSNTQYRNLQSFHSYMLHQKERKDEDDTSSRSIEKPFSFWIKEVEWDDDNVLNLVNHLNFYMSYYDTLSPSIIIHPPASGTEAIQPQTRYTAGRFPQQIAGKQIDDNLLHFWSACRSGDAARRFLYCYRIIEYASFSFIEGTVQTSIHKVLSAPHALDDLKEVTQQVLAVARGSKIEEPQRFEAVLRGAVDPALLWREINQNMDAFVTEIMFDGRFKLEPLVAVDSRQEDFAVNGIANFATAIRRIRNALSHGRDQRTAAVITPTTANFAKLQPWVSLISTAAGEVMLYKDVI